MGHNSHEHATQFSPYLPIEDYAIIGDLHTVALVGLNGSIDWCCMPRFDSPSIFASLLDWQKGGFFNISPYNMEDIKERQLYLPETNILMTRFLTVDGVAEVTDFMPIKHGPHDQDRHFIIRQIKVVRGSLSLQMTCRPAFDYARSSHGIQLHPEGAMFSHNQLNLALSSSVPLSEDRHGGVYARFFLHEGHTAHFVLKSSNEVEEPTAHEHTAGYYSEAFHRTKDYWQHWLAQCKYQGRWREMVQRSALVLKLLTYEPTGAIVAAPTTSLPEAIGQSRNWDYRFTWLRDSAFTLYSLLTLGFISEAEAFMNWLDMRCHELKDGGSLQPLYAIDGNQEITETILDYLDGYRGSKPVRIGNNAYQQLQLDIYGELMDAIYIYNRYASISYDLWKHLRHLLNWLGEHWQEPDDGIWEVRGGRKHFAHSRVMSWVAFDRALRIARHRGLPAPVNRWLETSADIYEEIIDKGWSREKNSFVQYYGCHALDASTLLMVLTKFAGPTDPLMVDTIKAIHRELSSDSLVYRYDPKKAAADGLGSQEGSFSACSFWLAEALAASGQVEEGRLMLEKMLTYSNHVGLYAEEIGLSGEALGNYPQAFTHLSLITACTNINDALDHKCPV